jgi:2-oxoglutarate ferredoxin oxidoreductase subunit delta
MSQVDRSPKSDATRASKPSKKEKKSPPEIFVKVSWCKGCGLCVEYCNRDVLKMDGVLPVVVDAEKCNRCLQCEVICPDFAIEIRDGDVEVVTAEGGEKS